MTTISNAAPRPNRPDPAHVGAGLKGLLQGCWRGVLALPRLLLDVYRRGGAMPLVAPAIVALIVVPEFAQHVVEIKLGMFVSKAGFAAHALDPLRMGFGAVKIAGLVACMLATARFWWSGRSLKSTFRIPLRDIGRIGLAILLLTAVSLPAVLVGTHPLGRAVDLPVTAASWLLQILFTAFLVGAVIGDRGMTLAQSVLRGWRTIPGMIVLGAAAFYPMSVVHRYAHILAIGKPAALVWVMMAGDALVVGLLALLTGSALFVAYTAALAPAQQSD